VKVGIIAWPMDEENKGGIGYFVENVVEQLIRLGLGDEIVLIRSRNSIEHVSRQIVLPTPGSGLFKRTMQRLFGLPPHLTVAILTLHTFHTTIPCSMEEQYSLKARRF